jgi:hypothetical protein
MLLASELERRNIYDVYYFENAKSLDDYTRSSFIQARDKALKRNKTMVVMIDEVHNNVTAALWTYLLKFETDIIVVGVGIPSLNGLSPQFRKKYSPTEMYFDSKSDDMKELIDVFVDKTKDRGISPDDVADICHYIFDYASGHMYPMLKFCEHIFDPAQSDHLGNYDMYFTSKECFEGKAYVDVHERCFSSLSVLSDPIHDILQKGFLLSSNIKLIDESGYWSNEKSWFISKCLVDVIFNTVIKRDISTMKNVKNVNFYGMSVEKKIETVIVGGLSEMTSMDFE